MSSKKKPATIIVPTESDDGVAAKVAAAILKYLGEIPESDERKSRKPEDAAKSCASAAAARAALAAGILLCRRDPQAG